MTKILILDDAETTRSFLKKTLEDEYDVTTAETWDQTRDILSGEAIDLLFLDCWLSEHEGLEVLEETRNLYDGPVIMISGYADYSIVNKARELGISRFLEKPLNPSDLRSTVTAVLSDENSSETEEAPREIKFYSQPRILLIHDDLALQEMLSHPLEHYDLPYRVVSNPQEALAVFREFEPDIVVIEAVLEGDPSSVDLLESMRGSSGDTYFIGISDDPENPMVESLRRKELAEFFYIPFPIPDLVRTLSHLSFVINQREKEPEDKPELESASQEFSGILYRRRLLIALTAILFGVALGFLVQWTQEWASDRSRNQYSVQRMYEQIRGYLERDEQRDLQN